MLHTYCRVLYIHTRWHIRRWHRHRRRRLRRHRRRCRCRCRCRQKTATEYDKISALLPGYTYTPLVDGGTRRLHCSLVYYTYILLIYIFILETKLSQRVQCGLLINVFYIVLCQDPPLLIDTLYSTLGIRLVWLQTREGNMDFLYRLIPTDIWRDSYSVYIYSIYKPPEPPACLAYCSSRPSSPPPLSPRLFLNQPQPLSLPS